MNGIVGVSNGDDARKTRENGVEVDILKNIIREHWQSKMDGHEKPGNRKIMADIEEHALNMHRILNAFDYEILSIPNIITSSKHMSRTDFKSYLNLMESLAVGYSNLLNRDLANLIMIGLTSKTRSIGTASKYFDMLSADLQKRIDFYNKKIDTHGKRIEILSNRLNSTERHILRIFFRKRIVRLRSRINLKTNRIRTLETRKARYSGLITNIRSRIEQNKLRP